MKKNFIKQKNFISRFIFLLFSFLFLVGLININVDPEKIYPEKIKIFKINFDLNSKIQKLILEEGYLIFNERYWNERKRALIFSKEYKKNDCIIFGSSQIMTVSLNQKPKVLSRNCKSILNLGVSGAVIEDYFALSNNINPKELKDKKIFLQIHPYTLNFNRDGRWLIYSDLFEEFLKKINYRNLVLNNPENLEFEKVSKLVKNLTSYDYLKSSLQFLFNSRKDNIKVVSKLKNSDEKSKKIILFDGSFKEVIKKKQKLILESKKINHRIFKDKWFDKNVFKLILSYKKYYEEKNEIIFLLTPYHPEVWKLKNEPIVEAMIRVEKKIHEFAKTNKMSVIGSFKPENLGCKRNDFIDTFHASNNCLTKLEDYKFKY